MRCSVIQSAAALLVFSIVWADIPTHCTLNDLVGSWKFILVQSPKDSTCGYSSPQTIKENWEQSKQLGKIKSHDASEKQLPESDPLFPVVDPSRSTVVKFDVRLTPRMQSGKGFLVLTPSGGLRGSSSGQVGGFWTPVFDQGLMLKNFQLQADQSGHTVAYSRALAYSAFHCNDPTGERCLKATDFSNDSHGNPPPQFQSMCSSTFVGWAVTSSGETHCFRGERLANLEVSDLVCEEHASESESSAAAPAAPASFEHEAVTWLRKKFPAENQGSCGSCYVHASLFALRASLLMAASAGEYETALQRLPSTAAALTTSTNQECQGGHPMFLGLALAVQHLPVKFDFLKGRYLPGCPDVAAMEEHIRTKGPLVVAVNVPSQAALDPHTTSIPADHFTELDEEETVHSKAGSETTPETRKIRVLTKLEHDAASSSSKEYQFANHAMVIVAYGTGRPSAGGESVPYWVVRNSWGPEWASDGYVHILRGQNVGGVESQVMTLTYDPSKDAASHFRNSFLSE